MFRLVRGLAAWDEVHQIRITVSRVIDCIIACLQLVPLCLRVVLVFRTMASDKT